MNSDVVRFTIHECLNATNQAVAGCDKLFQKVQNCLLLATKSVHKIMNIMDFIYFELRDEKISIGNSMIYSNIGHKSLETILKYHDWYLCQISSANHDNICLYYYPQRFCNFHM